ncbi:alpha/beta fold hydrolase [Actinophytocola sp. KF-1]
MRGLSSALAAWLRAAGRAGALLLANSAGCQVVGDLAEHATPVLAGPTADPGAPTLVRLPADVPGERPALLPLSARDHLIRGPRRFLATARALPADPVERKLANLLTPAVVVRGTRDPIASHEWAARVAARLPDGRLVEVPGAGHALNRIVLALAGVSVRPGRAPSPPRRTPGRSGRSRRTGSRPGPRAR